MEKPTLIVLEGVDEVGKSSVYQLLRRRTDYGPLVIDRFLASNFAYDAFLDRDHHVGDYMRTERALMRIFNCYLVYLTAELDELQARLVENGADPSTPAIAGIGEVDAYFRAYYQLSLFKKITINTTGQSFGKVTRMITDFLNLKAGRREVGKFPKKRSKQLGVSELMRVMRIWSGLRNGRE